MKYICQWCKAEYEKEQDVWLDKVSGLWSCRNPLACLVRQQEQADSEGV